MLEDDFTYVLLKALRGHGLSPSEAAARAGIPENDAIAFSRGHFDEPTARALAPVLRLVPDAFAGHPGYLPATQDLPAIHRLVLPFDEEHVNAWVISENGVHLLFDTGFDKTSCFEKIRELGIERLTAAFITHGHRDHIGGNDRLPRGCARSYGPKRIPRTRQTKPGDQFHFDDLTVKVVDLSGHCSPAFGYEIKGLEIPVLIPGDAIFAGSIGGCPDPKSYKHALKRIRHVTRHLPGETVILPGHGPATTLAEERSNNPFLASRK